MNYIKNKKIQTLLVFLVIMTLLAIVILQDNNDNNEEQLMTSVTVETITVSDYGTGAIGSFAPTASGNSFVVRSESSGRIDWTIEGAGTVSAGHVLARLENSSQQATLTQAQGAYEAALANAQQSNFSIESTEETLTSSYTTAKSVLRTTLISAQDIVESTIDSYFTDINRASLDLNQYLWEKKLIDYALDDWNQATINSIPDDMVIENIDIALSVSEDISSLLNTIYSHILDNEYGASESYKETLSSYKNDINSAKTTIATITQTLKDARLDTTDAQADLRRTQSRSLGGDVSAVEATVKQALGSLQAAEATYNKTIIKAPFSGDLIALNVSTGDVINTGTDIAIIIPADNSETDKIFNLPLSAIKYTPAGAYVLTVHQDGTLSSLSITTGLVRSNTIEVEGLTGNEVIVSDVRGLKEGDSVTLQ